LDVQQFPSILAGLQVGICNEVGPCRLSICDRYSDANGMNATVFMGKIVTQTLDLLSVNLSSILIILPYFQGKFGGYNFSADPTHTSQTSIGYICAIAEYVGKYIMNCSSGIGMSQLPRDLTSIHQNLPIGKLQFSSFISVFMQAVNIFAISAADQDVIMANMYATPGVCNQVDCYTTVAATYIFNTVPITSASPFYGYNIIGAVFTVDGNVQPTLNLTVNNTYVFQNDAPCSLLHQLYLSSHIEGPDSAGNFYEIQPNTSIVRGPLYLICGGDQFTFTPTQAMKDNYSGIYYNCLTHNWMGGVINLCDSKGCTNYALTAPPPTTSSSTAPVTKTTTVPNLNSGGLILISAFLISILSLLLI